MSAKSQRAPGCKPAPFDLVPTLAGVCKSIPALMAAMQNPFQDGSPFLPRNNETGRRLQPTACFIISGQKRTAVLKGVLHCRHQSRNTFADSSQSGHKIKRRRFTPRRPLAFGRHCVKLQFSNLARGERPHLPVLGGLYSGYAAEDP